MQPNILLICSDQHNARLAGCYGDQWVETPNLDRLARAGVTYEAAYCNAPLCVPSRMSFLTGRQPFRIGALTNGAILDSRQTTIAHALGGAGYHTALAGRMHFVGPDQYHGYLERPIGDIAPYGVLLPGSKTYHSYRPLTEEHLGNGNIPAPLRMSGAGETSVLAFDRAVTQTACDRLTAYAGDGGGPFFLTVGFHQPHCPYLAEPELFEKYRQRLEDVPLPEDEEDGLHAYHRNYIARTEMLSVSRARRKIARAAYYALVEFVDRNVGRLLDTLEATGLADNTIVVYMSDHGEMLGAHGRWHKSCFFEDSLRVPLIIRDPRRTPDAPTRIREPVSLVDLFPTLCAWGGVEIALPRDGDCLAPWAAAGSAPAAPRLIRAEYHDGPGGSTRMVRQGPWKLNYYGAAAAYELFNLQDDPGEINNLAEAPAARAVFDALQPHIFSDGWQADTLEAYNRQLEEMQFFQTVSYYRRGVENNPRAIDIPGYWAPMRTRPNFWLSPKEEPPQA
ncbi:MAG: sulfatase-like hydrolase/transferase [Candidatus Marinimicrobia bacterium]|nr:sulfatase-like hydrolase/transferase [Candidatus Neomarinimicrobiota bacterium]